MSYLDDVFSVEEDRFEFGTPVPAARTRGTQMPRKIPLQNRFSTCFATADHVALPKEPNVRVSDDGHSGAHLAVHRKIAS